MTPDAIRAAFTEAGLLHRYEPRSELGRGATGVVYLADDTFSQRQVAVKIAHAQIFREDSQQPQVRKAWLNEVHLAGTLQHPYIVSVFDAGVTPSTAYLVMEYLPKGTLEPFTRADSLKPVEEVLEILYKCASALDYACRAGIIHRDIKPANLQYVGPGEVKVGDFGAAYWSQGGEESTQVLDIGSLAYMAPELFRQWITPQADIYALGVVLYRLLTSRHPFEAPTQAALMYQILNGTPPRLSELRNDLPPELDAIAARMIARSLEERYESWPHVLIALGEQLQRLGRRTLNNTTAGARTPPQGELHDQLSRLPLLGELNGAELWELLRISRWHRVPTNTILVEEGAPARSFYVLLEGEAKVTQEGKLINCLSPGTLFGELAFAEATPTVRAATVTSTSDVTIGRFSYERLHHASTALQSKMLQIFFRLAAERLKKVDEQYLTLYHQHMQMREGNPA